MTVTDLTGYEAKASHMAEEARKANAAIERVRAIHQPVEAVNYHGGTPHRTQVCSGCGTDDGNWQIYPCPTIRALEVSR